MPILKPAVHAADHHRGNINAAITLVEYGDFECPHCRRAHPLVNRLLREMGDELHFVFRNFPLRQIHKYAWPSAVSAEAAGKQGKFWEMHDLIFEHQEKISASFLLILASDLGLDMDRFSKDLKSADIREKIQQDFDSGIRSGVNGTPGFFINGQPLLAYDETYQSLLNAVAVLK